MTYTVHSLLQPYLLNTLKGISIEQTTETLYGETLITRNRDRLYATFESAVDSQAWPIVETLLKLECIQPALSERAIKRILDVSPETFRNQFHLLPVFDSRQVEVIAPIATLCEYLLSQPIPDSEKVIHKTAYNSLLDNSESIPYRLRFIQITIPDKQIYLIQGFELFAALDYNLSLPVEKRTKLSKDVIQRLIERILSQSRMTNLPIEKAVTYLKSMGVEITDLNDWVKDPYSTHKLDCLLLPDEAFNDVQTTINLIKASEWYPFCEISQYITKPLSKETLCEMMCSYDTVKFATSFLSAIDLNKDGPAVLDAMSTSGIAVIPHVLKEALRARASATVSYLIKSFRDTNQHALIAVLQHRFTYTAFANMPKIQAYFELAGLSPSAARTTMLQTALLADHFKYLESKPTLDHLNHAVSIQHVDGTTYLLNVLDISPEVHMQLVETALTNGWKEGVELLSGTLSASVQKDLQTTTNCLFTTKANWIGEQEKKTYRK